MTTAERLQSIQASKEAIKAAIEAKGVECNDVLSTFAEKIAAIPTGGGSSEFSEYSYQVPTADEEGLRALGWDDDSIKYFKYNNLQYAGNKDIFKVSDENKALAGVITSKAALSSHKSDANLIYCPLFDTAKVTNMASMFSSCKALISVPLFDTSKVTNMAAMFSYCNSLARLPLFDMSKVEQLNNIFYECISLTSMPLFDISKVSNIAGMFYGCSNLISVPQFNTSSATRMDNMFSGCLKLISVPSLDASKVTDMGYMFSRCSSLTTLGGFTGLKTDLSLSSSPLLTHDSLMNVINEAADVTASPKTLTLGSTNLAKLTDEEKAIATGKGWTLA